MVSLWLEWLDSFYAGNINFFYIQTLDVDEF